MTEFDEILAESVWYERPFLRLAYVGGYVHSFVATVLRALRNGR